MANKPNTDESTVAALSLSDWFEQKTSPMFNSENYADYMAFLTCGVSWKTGSDPDGNLYFVTSQSDEDGEWLIRTVLNAKGETIVQEDIFENPELYDWGS